MHRKIQALQYAKALARGNGMRSQRANFGQVKNEIARMFGLRKGEAQKIAQKAFFA